MSFNQPLPLSGRDPDTVPLEEVMAELEEAERDPMKAHNAQRARRNAEQLERDRADLKERWLAAGSTEKEFERAWPEVRREQLKRRGEEAEAEARSESLRQMRKNF
jgi:hypothetical protein